MLHGKITQCLTALLVLTGNLLASGGAEESHEGLSSAAPLLWNPEIPFWPGHTFPISNSLVMFILAVLFITLTLRLATRKMKLIPDTLQNAVEWAFESLYNFLEEITGRYLAKKYFWFFSSIFFFILVSNYLGLIPGVGSITYEGKPLFRGANADFNVTIFLGLFSSVLWFVWVIREQGIKHFYSHIFGVKGKLEGIIKFILTPIFFFVGMIEVLSICIRPIALASRLYGNIFAGESIIEKMSLIHWATVIPFMGLEIIVGFVQALVFFMLTAIFLKTQLEEEESGEKH